MGRRWRNARSTMPVAWRMQALLHLPATTSALAAGLTTSVLTVTCAVRFGSVPSYHSRRRYRCAWPAPPST